MKKQIKNLILFLILVLSTNTVFCYELTYDEIYKNVFNSVNSEIKTQLKDYSCEYDILINGIPKQKITTSNVLSPKIEVIGKTDKFSPNSYRRILIKDEKGITLKAFAISIKTNVYKNVLSATNTIAYGEKINSSNSAIERKEVSKYLGKTYSNIQTDIVAKRNYQKGNVIISDYSKEKVLVSKNSDVDIIFQSKTLNIKLRGKALKDGSVGDTILVRSDKYNKTYNGIVKGENEVMVRI